MNNREGNSPNEAPMDSLDQRVSRLEKESQTMRLIILIAAFLLGAGVVLLGIVLLYEKKYDPIMERIISKSFIVVDNNSKPIISLTETGYKPTMIFYDKKGNSRTYLSLTEEGNPIISFLDDSHVIRSTFGLTDSGNPSIEFFDGEKQLRTRFGIIALPNETVSTLALLGTKGESGSNAVLVSSEKQGAILELTDDKGITRIFP